MGPDFATFSSLQNYGDDGETFFTPPQAATLFKRALSRDR